MLGLIFAAWIFHSIVPAGVEARKLVVAVPAMILFLFAGGHWLAKRFRWNPAIVAVLAAVVFVVQAFSIPRETHYGYSEAAEMIHSRPDLSDSIILVSSEHDGEGMLVSELAMRDRGHTRTILRGTKVLSSTDWNGNVFECYVRTPEQFLRYLSETNIGLVVSDTLPPVLKLEHQQVLQATLEKYPERFQLLGAFKGEVEGAVNVYRVK
jgi:hypothetical protein